MGTRFPPRERRNALEFLKNLSRFVLNVFVVVFVVLPVSAYRKVMGQPSGSK